MKLKPVTDENSRNVEEIIIPPEQREETLNELTQVLQKHYKISNLLSDSAVPKFLTRK